MHTTFIPSLILLCLPSHKGKAFLNAIIKERKPSWTWNYWKKDLKRKCPDDLDATALALAALSIHAPHLVDSNGLAAFTRALIGAEAEIGGPYYTWLVPSQCRKDWKDIDIAVNSNIAYFLSLHGVTLPNIVSMVERCIDGDSFPSLYYHEPLVTLYFISRWYKGEMKEKAIASILKRRMSGGLWSNPMLTAVAVTALLNFGYDHEKLLEPIHSLISYAKSEAWEAFPIYIEEKKEKTKYAQSREMTAAFVTEALTKYKEKYEEERKEETQADRIRKSILTTVEKKHPSLGGLIKSVIDNDKGDQILLLPYHFSQSIKNIDEDLCVLLGCANLCGWMAYKIYDDIMDNEGDPTLIPMANKCLRELTLIYSKILPVKHLPLFNKIMDQMEEANAWERKHCFDTKTSPDYGDLKILAYKSIGHALGPVVILLKAGYAPDSKEVKDLVSFFEHYLIARQLNDDAHDWADDLKRGFVNSASTLIFKKTELRDERKLKEIFWNETIDEVANLILYHISLARKHIKDAPYLSSLLIPIEQGAFKAIKEKVKVKEFLMQYE